MAAEAWESINFIIFLCRPGQPEPPKGLTLGELTDELAEYGPGTRITNSISGGPKFYAFEYQKPDESFGHVCKLKGIRLHYQNLQKNNYKSIRKMIVMESEPVQVTNSIIVYI